MKKITTCCAVLLVLASCKKVTNESTFMPQISTIKTFKWELRKEEGGIAGTLNYQVGNGTTIEFYANDSIKSVYPSSSISLIEIGTYAITSTNTVGDYYLTKKIMRNGTLINEQDSIRFNGVQLIFLAHNGWADEPNRFYEKM